MTDKQKLDAIKAEIHRLVDVRGYDREMANDLLAFMNSLPNEPVSEDLEEAANEYAKDYLFAPKPQSAPNIHFINGANWQKQQMIKDAVDGKIYETQARSKLKAATIGKISCLKYRVGDKVKLIILKEE